MGKAQVLPDSEENWPVLVAQGNRQPAVDMLVRLRGIDFREAIAEIERLDDMRESLSGPARPGERPDKGL